MRIRGCPIPADSDTVQRGICFPATWAGLISDLLLPPTKDDFWDRTANQEDIDFATQTAEDIVHDFLSPECVCIGNNGPSELTQVVWDFGLADHDFVVTPGGHGVYQYGHWESEKYQGEFDYWYSDLSIERLIDPEVWPVRLKGFYELNCYSGPVLTFPRLSMTLYGTEASPVASWMTEFNAGYWSQASFRPVLTVQSYRSVKADVVAIHWRAVAASETIIDTAYCVLSKLEFDYDLPL